MTKDAKDANDLELKDGDCFGWYSSVHKQCLPGSCIESERCKAYTVRRSEQARGIIKERTEASLATPSVNNTPRRQASQMSDEIDPLAVRSFFDSLVLKIAKRLKSTDIHWHPDHAYATIKQDRRVLATCFKKKLGAKVKLDLNDGGKTKEEEFTFGQNEAQLDQNLAKLIK